MIELNTLYHENNIDTMSRMPNNFVDTIITDPPYGLRFMGKKWDYSIPSVDTFAEMLRIAKPGSTLLCFGGSRTFHRMAVNIEDAGWEIKDTLMWLYGSGFPKATNISKQFSKNGDNENAENWNGWKSHALKPAYEPIILAIKRNEGSYVDNALKYGVSGLNIDGGRIPLPHGENTPSGSGKMPYYANGFAVNKVYGNEVETNPKGRYPANIILDEYSAEILDQQSGERKSGSNNTRKKEGFFIEHGGLGKAGDVQVSYGDKGGASRFFYVAKSSQSEKNKGCEEREEREERYSDDTRVNKDAVGCNNPHNRSGTPKKNHHPTVKPIKLMKYLCELTKTPTGGIVYDPYSGSGSTLIAAKLTGRDYIGSEMEKEFYEIAKARLKANDPDLTLF